MRTRAIPLLDLEEGDILVGEFFKYRVLETPRRGDNLIPEENPEILYFMVESIIITMKHGRATITSASVSFHKLPLKHGNRTKVRILDLQDNI